MPGDGAVNGTVVLATTPQSLTWPHFAEGTTHPAIQVPESVCFLSMSVLLEHEGLSNVKHGRICLPPEETVRHRVCGLARRLGFQVLTVVTSAAQHSLPRLQAAEFADGGARALAGMPVEVAKGPNDWQPVIWRGMGFDYNELLSSAQVFLTAGHRTPRMPHLPLSHLLHRPRGCVAEQLLLRAATFIILHMPLMAQHMMTSRISYDVLSMFPPA